MALDFDEFNGQVKDWARGRVQVMRTTGTGMGIHHRQNSPSTGASLEKLRAGFKYQAGAVSVISFRFPRQLIWTHKGAGKGRGGAIGSTWVDKYEATHRTNPKSLGKMGTGGRKAKPWFTQSLDSAGGVETLADLVAENLGATITNNILKEN